MHVHTALAAIGALTLTAGAFAGDPQPDPQVSIHAGLFRNTGWGQIEYVGAYASYISVTAAPQEGTMFPTLIELDLTGLLLDGGYNAFTEVTLIDTGENQYGETSPGADIDLLALTSLDPALDVTFAYAGPNDAHQSEDSATLETRLQLLDARSGETDSEALRHVSLGDGGELTASITGWTTDGGNDGGAGPITPAMRGAGSGPMLQFSESGNGESYDVYITATTIPAPGALVTLGAAALLGRRRRRNRH